MTHLVFKSELFERWVRWSCTRAEIPIKPKWLGTYFQKEILEGKTADLSVVQVDEVIGKGVIANRDIPPMTFIGEYTGWVRFRRWWGRKQNVYCFDYPLVNLRGKGRWVIDASEIGNITRFVNHSDKPNVEVAAAWAGGLFHVILYAKEPISKGDQLFYDYGPDFWEVRGRIKREIRR